MAILVLASMKLLTNSKNPFSNPLKRHCNGDFVVRIQEAACDPENLFREAVCVRYTGQKSKDGNPPMAEKKSCTEILQRLPEHYSELVSFF